MKQFNEKKRIKEILNEFEEQGNEIIIATRSSVGFYGTLPVLLTILTNEMSHLRENGAYDEILNTAVKLSSMDSEELETELQKETMKMLKNLVGLEK